MNRKIWRVWSAATACLEAASGVLLIASAWQVYRAGYSPAHVIAAFRRIAPVIWAAAAFAAAGLLAGRPETRKTARVQAMEKPARTDTKRQNILRAALLAAAAAMIALGAANGGVRDVLVKAISICTECIGLG